MNNHSLLRLQNHGTVSLRPKHVKGTSTLAAFKGSLRDFLNQIPDMTSSTGYSGVNHNSILDWAKQNN